MSGKRFNEGKAKIALIPAEAEMAEARVWTKGAVKYGENFNWHKGGEKLTFTEILSSLGRHLNYLKKGQDIDSESGEHHAAHIRCNAAMLIEFYYEGRVELDDRMQSEFRDLLKGDDDESI